MEVLALDDHLQIKTKSGSMKMACLWNVKGSETFEANENTSDVSC